MHGNDITSGYLDVKISARTRRGFTPWKVRFYYFIYVVSGTITRPHYYHYYCYK